MVQLQRPLTLTQQPPQVQQHTLQRQQQVHMQHQLQAMWLQQDLMRMQQHWQQPLLEVSRCTSCRMGC